MLLKVRLYILYTSNSVFPQIVSCCHWFETHPLDVLVTAFFQLLQVLLEVSRCMYIITRVVTRNLIYWSTLQMMLSGALLFWQYVYLMTQANTLWQTLVEV